MNHFSSGWTIYFGVWYLSLIFGFVFLGRGGVCSKERLSMNY
uniref:Uncharacterized protein n=1 Tax=Rhizophora mucronata TaxID=61149 RepID=A0A2P2QSX8_RHIMU